MVAILFSDSEFFKHLAMKTLLLCSKFSRYENLFHPSLDELYINTNKGNNKEEGLTYH